MRRADAVRMGKILSHLDRATAWALIALGCVHIFIAAPYAYPELSEPALWFMTGGLALWYCGALNVARVSHPEAAHLRLAALFASVTLLVFVLLWGTRTGELWTALGLVLAASIAAQTLFALRTVLSARA